MSQHRSVITRRGNGFRLFLNRDRYPAIWGDWAGFRQGFEVYHLSRSARYRQRARPESGWRFALKTGASSPADETSELRPFRSSR